MKSTEQLLHALGKSMRGKMHLINMWDSCEDSLIAKPVLRNFLSTCITEWSKNPTKMINEIFEMVCQQKNRGGQFKFLRQARVPTVHHSTGHTTWSRIDRWDSFFEYHLTDKFKSAAPVGIPILPNPPPLGRMQQIRRNLKLVINHSDWRKSGATLGRPASDPCNCWISDAPVHFKNPDESCADANRDQRGLDYALSQSHARPERTQLIAYSFARDSAVSAADGVVARPGFADGGNKRFRAYDPGVEGRNLADIGWGATLHLEKFASNDHPEQMFGTSERVVPGLLISNLHDLKVEYLGPLTHLRGQTSFDDDAAFIRILQRGRSLADIKKNILAYVA